MFDVDKHFTFYWLTNIYKRYWLNGPELVLQIRKRVVSFLRTLIGSCRFETDFIYIAYIHTYKYQSVLINIPRNIANWIRNTLDV